MAAAAAAALSGGPAAPEAGGGTVRRPGARHFGHIAAPALRATQTELTSIASFLETARQAGSTLVRGRG